MRRRRRIAAYGVCRQDGRILLVRLSGASAEPGYWLPPGGGIEHGEHPANAVVREIAEETGLTVKIVALRDVVADVVELVEPAEMIHNDRVIYDVAVAAGTLRNELRGSTDRARWVSPEELAALPLLPFAARTLRVPEAAALPPEQVAAVPPERVVAVPPERVAAVPPERVAAAMGQRFAAYGLVTDPAGRVLLTLIAPGFPGAGRWHLPGGGTDFGEQPADAVLRELGEEADQAGRVVGLLDVSHRRNPRALGPEGYPIDWHAVRALYRVRVEAPTHPRVNEPDGSTIEAAWFSRADALRLPLTEIAASVLNRYAQ